MKTDTRSEAFNETVEELTQSLMPLFAEKGMDWMYANCSTTAQRGALDWMGPFHDATKPVFAKLYAEVVARNEAQRSIDTNLELTTAMAWKKNWPPFAKAKCGKQAQWFASFALKTTNGLINLSSINQKTVLNQHSRRFFFVFPLPKDKIKSMCQYAKQRSPKRR